MLNYSQGDVNMRYYIFWILFKLKMKLNSENTISHINFALMIFWSKNHLINSEMALKQLE